MISDNNNSPLEWPEAADDDECAVFYSALLNRLGSPAWVVITPTPAPLGAIRRAIEADCHNLLQPIAMAYDGVAWLCPRSAIADALPGLFHARRPELVFLTFDTRPDLAAITTALQSPDAHPAKQRLIFEDGELIKQYKPV